jgi:hypothetical protein
LSRATIVASRIAAKRAPGYGAAHVRSAIEHTRRAIVTAQRHNGIVAALFALSGCFTPATSIARWVDVHSGGALVSTLPPACDAPLARVVREAREATRSPVFASQIARVWPAVEHRDDAAAAATMAPDAFVAALRARVEERLSFYCHPFARGSSAIAADGAGARGVIGINCGRDPIASRSTDPVRWRLYARTVVHELTHSVGFRHEGNEAAGNECTLPYLAGDIALSVLTGDGGASVQCERARLLLQDTAAASPRVRRASSVVDSLGQRARFASDVALLSLGPSEQLRCEVARGGDLHQRAQRLASLR